MVAQTRKGKILTSPCLPAIVSSCKGAPVLSSDHRPFVRLALIVALAASFALGACGRKGPLDPPPAASIAGEQAASTGAPESGPTGYDGKPLAPGGANKRIPIDVLLN
jgi:predicted small lipoprotein YifL